MSGLQITVLISIFLNVILILLGIKFDIFRKTRKSIVRNTIKKTIKGLTGIDLSREDFEEIEEKIGNIEGEYKIKYQNEKQELDREVLNSLKFLELTKFIGTRLSFRGIKIKERVVRLLAELMVNSYKRVS